MNHQPISTHPILQDFFKLRMTNQGQLIVDEDIAHQHKSRNPTSGCHDQETYQMNGRTYCGFCGNECETY